MNGQHSKLKLCTIVSYSLIIVWTISSCSCSLTQPDEPLPPIFIMVVGVSGCGKSFIINAILNKTITETDPSLTIPGVTEYSINFGPSQPEIRLIDIPELQGLGVTESDAQILATIGGYMDAHKHFHSYPPDLTVVCLPAESNDTFSKIAESLAAINTRLFKINNGTRRLKSNGILIALTTSLNVSREVRSDFNGMASELKKVVTESWNVPLNKVAITFVENPCEEEESPNSMPVDAKLQERTKTCSRNICREIVSIINAGSPSMQLNALQICSSNGTDFEINLMAEAPLLPLGDPKTIEIYDSLVNESPGKDEIAPEIESADCTATIIRLRANLSSAMVQLSEERAHVEHQQESLYTAETELGVCVNELSEHTSRESALEIYLRSSREQVADLRVQMEDQHRTIRSFDTELGTLTSNLTECQKRESWLESYLNSTEVQLEAKDSRLAENREELIRVNLELDLAKNTVTECHGRETALALSLNSTQEQVLTMTVNVDQQHDEIVSLKGDLEAERHNVAECLRREIIQSFKTDQESGKDVNVVEQHERLNIVQTSIGALRSNLTECRSREALLESQLSSYTEQVKAKEAQILELKGNIAQLETELGEQTINITELRNREMGLETVLNFTRDQMAVEQARFLEEHERANSIETEVSALENVYTECRSRETGLDLYLSSVKERLAQTESDIGELYENLNAAQNDLRVTAGNLTGCELREASLESQLNSTISEFDRKAVDVLDQERKLNTIVSELEVSRTYLTECRSQTESLKGNINFTKEEKAQHIAVESDLRQNLTECQNRETLLETQVNFTTGLMTRNEGLLMTERAALNAAQAQLGVVLRNLTECESNGWNLSAVPFYRYSNNKNGRYFYTTDQTEPAVLGPDGDSDYVYDGVAAGVYSDPVTGAFPLYRYYKEEMEEHDYTLSFVKYGRGKDGFLLEAVACYIYAEQVKGTVPLFRYHNSGNGDHLLTANSTDINEVYTSDGIAGYVFPPEI